MAYVAVIGSHRSKTGCTGASFQRLVIVLDKFHITQIVQEFMEAGGIELLSLNFQGALKTCSNQEFQVVSQASDQGQKFLSDTQLSYTTLLSFRQEGKELYNLLA